MAKFYSHLRIGFNCKSQSKAEKIKVKIEKAIQLPIYNTEYLAQNNNVFELVGYCELDYPSKEVAVFNWFFHLELLGNNWQSNAPSIYEDFFSFEGERWANEQNFKIPGMTSASFELTDRPIDYYDSAPLGIDQKVRILISEFTTKEQICGLEGYIATIAGRNNGKWVFGVFIYKLEQIYMLSEGELEINN